MEKNKSQEAGQKEDLKIELQTVEALSQKLSINPSVIAGIKIMNGWADGKVITEAEIKKAVEDFGKAPIHKGVNK